MKLEFTVWQFVRLMVELESRPRQKGPRARQIFQARYASLWDDLDKDLERLAEADPTKYAKRMMKDTIVVNTKSVPHILEVTEALGRVINQMAGELRKGSRDDLAQRTNIQFEQRELQKLRAKLVESQREKD